jgi:hypothetical protein
LPQLRSQVIGNVVVFQWIFALSTSFVGFRIGCQT